MLKAATERLRLRAAEKISSDCSTGNLMVARSDLTAALDALDLAEGIMPPAIVAKAKALRMNVREARYAAGVVEAAGIQNGATGASRADVATAHKWQERTVDAASALVEAVLAYEHTGGSGAPSCDPSGAAHEETAMTNTERVKTEQAEVHARVQQAVDRNVAARVELDASNTELADIENELVSGDAATLNFLRAYRNPQTENPPPIAPDIAAPPPAEEPPVFTDVSTPEITPDNTSGGFTEEVAAVTPVEGFADPVVEAPADPATGRGGTEAG